jgi:hypothetical protein
MSPVMNTRLLFLAAISSAASFACGGTSVDSFGTLGGSDASVTLTVPLGLYSGCSLSTVAVGSHFEALTAGAGTVTLGTEGGGALFATLAFGEVGSPSSVSARGKVALTPASRSSAAFAPGQSFDLEYSYFLSIGDPPMPITKTSSVTTTAGSMTLVGDTLFISATGELGIGADAFNTFVECPVPESLARSRVVARGASSTPLPTGVYRSCTSALENGDFSGSAGGIGSVTVEKLDGSLKATWSDATVACGSLDFTATSDSIATLTAGQTCIVQQPCGPPPSLGEPTSPIPGATPLSNTVGTMTGDGRSLFIDLVGDIAGTCGGRRRVSILCTSGG